MTKRMVVVFILALSVFTLGCEPKIDGSSEEAFDESVEEVSDSLSEEEREYFEMYIGSMLMVKAFEFGFDPDVEDLDRELYGYFDGMTASDLSDKAEELEQEGEIEWPTPEEWQRDMEESGQELEGAAQDLEGSMDELEQGLDNL